MEIEQLREEIKNALRSIEDAFRNSSKGNLGNAAIHGELPVGVIS
jgi:hypothetical protein